MNYTRLLSEMKTTDEPVTRPLEDHTTLCGTRQRLKTKREFKGWHWKFKIAGDEVFITRVR